MAWRSYAQRKKNDVKKTPSLPKKTVFNGLPFEKALTKGIKRSPIHLSKPTGLT